MARTTVVTDASAIVDVQIDATAADLPAAGQIAAWIRRALAAAAADCRAEVSVRVVDKEEMRQLNHTYRQQDKVTNVLSFPADLPAIAPAATQTGDESLPGFDYQLLGDIVVCAAVLSEEAAAQGKRVADHWAHMLVHGTLHLLGYDHLGESDAARMEAQEVEILRSYGIADPYWVD